jgi:tyrosyl-tRNA synthetase
MLNVIDVLEERGFIDAMTSEGLREKANNPLKVYCGFDPTAESLHLGNMIAIMGLAWFQRYGHTPVAIVGGATGMIGDPSGKSSERQLLEEATIEKNLEGIRKNLAQILDFSKKTPQPIILNNFDWFKDFSFIDFLRDVGKFFRMGPMLAKDSVKARMTSEDGMSFTEFSYQLLQGYDYLHLFDHYDVTVQLGGSDQWGNIIAGTDLIRKVHGKSAHGITFPLLTRSDGQKFGKSEKGAIWLSPDWLSPYEFYQYLYRTAEADVIKLMRMLTFMEMSEILQYEGMMKEPNYIPNTAQKRLATEVTRIVHGDEAVQIALKVTEGAAPGSKTELNSEVLEKIAEDMPSKLLDGSELMNINLLDLMVKIGLQPSKNEARRLMKNGGVYLNNVKILNEDFIITSSEIIEDKFLLLAAGKKNKILIRLKKSDG